MAGDQRTGIVGVTRDVTERKLFELRLATLATIDGLTGLTNRRAFDEALAREVARWPPQPAAPIAADDRLRPLQALQ